MQHNNISIFIPHIGCPNKCSFCNQNSITGGYKAPTPQEVNEICNNAFARIENKAETEVAFFGGSFTAIEKSYMISLLECVQEFIGIGKFKGIRISTRPDCIDQDILTLLKKYNVTAIELGAQSMDNYILEQNDRGHTAQDVINSSDLIKSNGFELGLQMMIGLYKSTPDIDINTAEEIIKLNPDTVRIYPVVVLENTRLGELYKNGEYKPYSIETGVEISTRLIEMFEDKGIRIIKLGLHASELVEGEMLGGLYHPAFRELCDNKIFYNKIYDAVKKSKYKSCTVLVPKNSVSKATGQNKCNIKKLKEQGYDIKIKPSDFIENYDIMIIEEEATCI